MAVITRISAQQKNDERFNIFIQKGTKEEFAFSVDADVLIKFQLQKGMEINEEEWEEIIDEDQFRKAFNKALHFLSYRMRTVHEIEAFLEKKEVPEHTVKRVISRLSEYDFVNDKSFADAFVKSRMNTSFKGPGAIRQELKKKGIGEIDSEGAISQFTYEQQLEASVKFIQKQFSGRAKRSEKEQKQKIAQQLQQKGFTWEVIELAFQQAQISQTAEEEKEALLVHAKKAHNKYKKHTGYEYEARMKRYLYGKGFDSSVITELLSGDELTDQ
ncbi:recombination regulator RecX [Fictibacillus nanhaiensis]|uniref:recombination regulator RecX n=1 Tax=Fictibacillus nanhaiensis TaxID=742169 RepID=UPI001C97DF44|nr:recombination regulator RecX [Fictibacillus nanhaiensis]MBY6038375.1 recombination regulator RecX [Fictibacillus nanhaiensis]